MHLFRYLFAFGLLLPFQMVFSQENRPVDLVPFHAISSHDLLDYAAELSSARYAGRLSGSPEYVAAAEWVARQLSQSGLKPAVGDSSFFHWFPNAYTRVLKPGRVVIHATKNIKAHKLAFPDDFYPGSNSASGKVTGKVVYAGYGISAPELNYDDYAGMDVKGKIILIEAGVPYLKNDSTLKNWEPYSYHRYKFQRAREMGAVGLLYTGLTANPNTSFLDGFVYAHISEQVAGELLDGPGKKFAGLKDEITKTMQPQSFSTNKTVSISASTLHFPDSKSCNVAGIIEGTDSVLKNEAIIVGAHLDAVGHPGALFPGALDNASGVANLIAAAKALASSKVKPLRTVIFVFFGGEECGLYGSKLCITDPLWPKNKVVVMLNLDMVGNGTGFHLQGGLSYPGILTHFQKANDNYIHRTLASSENRISYGRPRTDSAVFQKDGYKTMNLWTTGTVKKVYYHQPLDNTDALTPEIMEDAARLLYLGLLGVANDREL